TEADIGGEVRRVVITPCRAGEELVAAVAEPDFEARIRGFLEAGGDQFSPHDTLEVRVGEAVGLALGANHPETALANSGRPFMKDCAFRADRARARSQHQGGQPETQPAQECGKATASGPKLRMHGATLLPSCEPIKAPSYAVPNTFRRSSTS